MTIECFGFTSHESGFLQGFADLKVPKMGIKLFGCGLFSKGGRSWLSLPSRDYIDKESGEKKYIPVMDFIDSDHKVPFSKEAMEAVQKFRAEDQSEMGGDSGDLPF